MFLIMPKSGATLSLSPVSPEPTMVMLSVDTRFWHDAKCSKGGLEARRQPKQDTLTIVHEGGSPLKTEDRDGREETEAQSDTRFWHGQKHN